MAITFPSSTQTTASNRPNTTPTLPSGLSAGDYVVTALYIESGASIVVPTGYTAPSPGSILHTPGNDFAIFIAYRKWQSGDGNPTWDYTGSAYTQGACVRVAGADGTTFLDPTAPTTEEADNATAQGVSGGITTANNNSALLLIVSHWTADNPHYSAWTSPLTEIFDGEQFGGGGGVQVTAGASGGKTATGDFGSDYAAILMGIKEAGAAATSRPVFQNRWRTIRRRRYH